MRFCSFSLLTTTFFLAGQVLALSTITTTITVTAASAGGITPPEATPAVTNPGTAEGPTPAGVQPPAANPAPIANSTTSSNCPAASILAAGIADNIQDQLQEQAALSSYSQLLSQAAPNAIQPEAFASAKAQLLTFVNNGIAIRQANQQITPPGNPATAGIAMVANAQLMELSLSSGLTGTQGDRETITTLDGMFKMGADKNRENMRLAVQGC